MEQDIRCSNHPDKNAIRLCGDCGMPFCTECLRKNLLGFYYCQRCYPRLFKNTSVPEYEIPRDEKGLKAVRKQIELEIKEDSIIEPFKIVLTIGLCIFLFNFIIFFTFSNLNSNFGWNIWTILCALITYFLAGLYCGKRWPEISWRWGFWLTIPYGCAIILLYVYFILAGTTDSGMAAFFIILLIFDSFVRFLISSFGAYVGFRLRKSVQILLTKTKTTNR